MIRLRSVYVESFKILKEVSWNANKKRLFVRSMHYTYIFRILHIKNLCRYRPLLIVRHSWTSVCSVAILGEIYVMWHKNHVIGWHNFHYKQMLIFRLGP